MSTSLAHWWSVLKTPRAPADPLLFPPFPALWEMGYVVHSKQAPLPSGFGWFRPMGATSRRWTDRRRERLRYLSSWLLPASPRSVVASLPKGQVLGEHNVEKPLIQTASAQFSFCFLCPLPTKTWEKLSWSCRIHDLHQPSRFSLTLPPTLYIIPSLNYLSLASFEYTFVSYQDPD